MKKSKSDKEKEDVLRYQKMNGELISEIKQVREAMTISSKNASEADAKLKELTYQNEQLKVKNATLETEINRGRSNPNPTILSPRRASVPVDTKLKESPLSTDNKLSPVRVDNRTKESISPEIKIKDLNLLREKKQKDMKITISEPERKEPLFTISNGNSSNTFPGLDNTVKIDVKRLRDNFEVTNNSPEKASPGKGKQS